MNGGGVRCGFWPRMVIAPSSVMIIRSPSLSLSQGHCLCVGVGDGLVGRKQS